MNIPANVSILPKNPVSGAEIMGVLPTGPVKCAVIPTPSVLVAQTVTGRIVSAATTAVEPVLQDPTTRTVLVTKSGVINVSGHYGRGRAGNVMSIIRLITDRNWITPSVAIHVD